MGKREENPFEDKIVAEEWIKSVENEKGLFRDKEIYPRLNKWIREQDPKKILEIGSGQGICSSKIDLVGRSYLGIEPSKALLDRANELYKSKTINFKEGNSYDLTVGSGEFDGCFSVVVWLHLENLNLAAKEMAKSLKKNGSFYIVTANPEAYEGWFALFENPIRTATKIEGKVQIPGNPLSKNVIYSHSEQSLIDSFINNGLTARIDERFGAGGEGGGIDYFISIIGVKS